MVYEYVMTFVIFLTRFICLLALTVSHQFTRPDLARPDLYITGQSDWSLVSVAGHYTSGLWSTPFCILSSFLVILFVLMVSITDTINKDH